MLEEQQLIQEKEIEKQMSAFDVKENQESC